MNQLTLRLNQPLIDRAAQAMEQASHITSITSRISLTAAVKKAGELKGVVRDVESERKSVLQPYETAKKELMDLCRTFVEPIQAEIVRLERAASAWQFEQDRKAREEADRLRAEQEKRDREAREAAASTPAPVASRVQQAAEALKQPAQLPVAPRVAPSNVSGASVERFWDWEVVDPWALAQHSREAVKLEVKASVINQWVKAGSREIPGIRIFEATRVTSRAS